MNLNGTIKKTQALSGRLVKSSGGGGSVQEIYWVQYGVGTATNAEVNTAVTANKLPVCYWDSTNAYGQTTRRLYFLIRHTPTEALFATVDSTNETIIVRRLYADEWNTQTIRYEGKLTWDQTPRFGSVNPVTSGGIYNAIQNATVSDERIAEAVDDWLSVQAPSIGTLSYAAKQALLACFRKVAWIDDQGQSYYNALESELFPDATLESITAVFTQGSAVIYDTDSLDTLKQYLTVTATFSDSTTATVSDYTLSGTLTAGTSTITVSYGGKTDTFSVSVADAMLYSTYNVAISTSEAGVNTGVKLLSEDQTFTILFDANKTTALSAGYRFFHCLQTASPWKGIYVGSSNESGVSATDAQWFSARQAFAVGRSTIGRIRMLYAHEQGTDMATFMWKLDDGNIGTFTISNAYIIANGDLYIGSNNANSNFVGTVTKFEVYRTLLGQSAINDFFGDSE